MYLKYTNPRIGVHALRASLAFIFLMFGIAKFALYEAEGVARTAEHYWLFSWMYPLWGVQGASNAIGTVELIVFALTMAGFFSVRAALLGGLMGMATFVVTLSFTIGAELWKEGYGFPFMNGSAQFLFKDIVLLAGCLVLTLDAARQILIQYGAREG